MDQFNQPQELQTRISYLISLSPLFWKNKANFGSFLLFDDKMIINMLSSAIQSTTIELFMFFMNIIIYLPACHGSLETCKNQRLKGLSLAVWLVWGESFQGCPMGQCGTRVRLQGIEWWQWSLGWKWRCWSWSWGGDAWNEKHKKMEKAEGQSLQSS